MIAVVFVVTDVVFEHRGRHGRRRSRSRPSFAWFWYGLRRRRAAARTRSPHAAETRNESRKPSVVAKAVGGPGVPVRLRHERVRERGEDGSAREAERPGERLLAHGVEHAVADDDGRARSTAVPVQSPRMKGRGASRALRMAIDRGHRLREVRREDGHEQRRRARRAEERHAERKVLRQAVERHRGEEGEPDRLAARLRASPFRRSSQASTPMKTVAPTASPMPARHAPPFSNASSKRSKATAVMSAPEANASSAPWTGARRVPPASRRARR